jgi:hypothetical protein
VILQFFSSRDCKYKSIKNFHEKIIAVIFLVSNHGNLAALR